MLPALTLGIGQMVVALTEHISTAIYRKKIGWGGVLHKNVNLRDVQKHKTKHRVAAFKMRHISVCKVTIACFSKSAGGLVSHLVCVWKAVPIVMVRYPKFLVMWKDEQNENQSTCLLRKLRRNHWEIFSIWTRYMSEPAWSMHHKDLKFWQNIIQLQLE